MNYNGSAIVAMRGNGCVAIGADRRLGARHQMVANDYQRIFEVTPGLFLALSGLATDVQTVIERIRFRVKLYELREERLIRPRTLVSLVSSFLYEHRFAPYFIEPVIAGIDSVTGEAVVASTDLIGCPVEPRDFVVVGTANEQLYGLCETLWRPEMNAETLFEATAQSLLNACDRDAMSGAGAHVYLVTKDSVSERVLKSRTD